jgi:biopolymer transport protein ExbB
MIPIILCSIIALAIIGERIWALQKRRICPKHLLAQIWNWIKNNELDTAKIKQLQSGSPLGRILAAGLLNRGHDRAIMKEAIEETGRQVVIDMERFLNTLGTISLITPLLGLLGTVIGMIKVFTAITVQGVGDANQLAGGISEALITTAAGLAIAIPSLMCYRYFQRKVDELVISMEQESLKLVEVLLGMREQDLAEAE